VTREEILSNPKRQEILKLLGDGPINAGNISHKLKMKPPNVSSHLSILMYGGLIEQKRVGRFRIYSLSEAAKALDVCKEDTTNTRA
jgi:DNA-binding transcriptional ArsR family regulator